MRAFIVLHADLGFAAQQVERFFAGITRNRIRRGAFRSVAELKSAIMEYVKKIVSLGVV